MRQLILSILSVQRILLLFVTLLIMNCKRTHAQTTKIKGVTINSGTMLPVPYVSIGVKNKPIGTVSDSTGRYSFSYLRTEVADKDSIFFSAVGYRSVRMAWDTFLKTEKSIQLDESPHLLETVQIQVKPGQVKNYGRANASIIFFPAMYKDMPGHSDEKGREQATILKIDQNVFLRKLSFKINKRTFRKIKFRMNIYSVKDGLPDQSLLRRDVVFDISGTIESGPPSAETIDLRPYQIHIKGRREIAVSLAILDLEPLPGDSINPAFFIPSFPGPLRSSLYRIKSEAAWQKVSSSSLLINIEASSLNADKKSVTESQPDIEAEITQNNPALSKLLYGNNKGGRIKVDNGEIYYEIYGQGIPLFLLHGNNENINSFREQIEPLSRYFKVIALDSRGHGNSINKSLSPYTYELFAKDLSVVMDSLVIKKASLLGWSDGGNTALIFSLKYPEKIDKVVLMGANLFPGFEAIEEETIRIFENRRDSLLKRNDLESQNQLRLADLVLKEPHINAQELQHIVAPVLVIAGEFDVVKKKHTVLIHSQIKDSRLEIIAGSDHYAPIKNPEVFNRVVLDFLLPEKRLD